MPAGPASRNAPAAPAARTAPPAPTTAGAPAAGVRIAKLITERGIASRREADDWIAAGWVRCEGRVAVLGQRVAPDAAIEIDPRARREQARRVTVLLNKPLGYVSGQAEDGHEPASVLVTPENRWREDPSRVPLAASHLRGLAPAGRLDIDSTGLLVLTQDGRIAKLLIGDQTRVEKEYLVRVRSLDERPVAAADLGLLRHGLELDGVPLKPAQVSWANEDQLRVVLREGRKRQIRRMCELVGLQVVALKRVRIGSVVLGALPAGQWRLLGEHERF
ncbi:MAG: rRNA pseudouridine synthase [Rubrivivax sp.]|nr:rRNA pseudouridine synthase [Rubrivivax sp.]